MTPGESLDTPAIQFFTLLIEARKIRETEKNCFMVDFLDAFSIGLGNVQYYHDMRNHFVERVYPRKVVKLDESEAASWLIHNIGEGRHGR